MILIDRIPPLLTDKELIKALSKCPHYDSNLTLTKSERLLKLLDIYDLFIPTHMSVEIYNTLYFSLVRSLNRKATLIDNLQMLENRKIMNGASIIGGINSGDCSLIIGSSGLGKSNSISRAVDIISNNKTIEMENPYCSIIPILTVEAPSLSIKAFFYAILKAIDNKIGTNYYNANCNARISTDLLIGAVANALLLHCGLLVVDEVDRLVDRKNSISFIHYITELINLSGISVVFCGVPNALNFFQSTDYLARRSMGQIYKPMDYGQEFFDFINSLFDYQYTQNKVEVNSEILRTIYKLTNGNTSMIISLFVNAQKWAITNNNEQIDTHSLLQAYNQNMSIMTPHLQIQKTTLPPPHYEEDISIAPHNNITIQEDNIFIDLPPKSEKDIDKAIEILQQEISVEIIKI